MKSKPIEQFGINVRRLREKKGLSQEQLAELADMHTNYVGFIERGERNITIKKIVQIAKALRIKPNQVFKDIF
jgi:transcriptional regulator with XRE-family HTH domain